MGRKKRNPEESSKRRAILKAAEKMFMALSYNDVSMDALASAVPVSKRTLYNHFKDKEALFTAVMQARCQMIFDEMAQTIQEGKSIRHILTKVAKNFLSVVFEPDAINIYRTALTEAKHFPKLGKLFYESGPMRSTSILAGYLREKDKEGVLKVSNPELAATLFMGMLTNRMQMMCLLGIKKQVSAREKQEILQMAVDIFLGGLGTS